MVRRAGPDGPIQETETVTTVAWIQPREQREVSSDPVIDDLLSLEYFVAKACFAPDSDLMRYA